MSETILITGASGNIGSHLVQELATTDHPILRGTRNKSEPGKQNKIFLDFSDQQSLVEAFKGVDTVFLLFPMVERMVEYAENAVEAANEAGVKRIIRSSGAGSDRSAGFLMPRVQGTIDELITNSGIPYVITQPSSFMQNFFLFHGGDLKNGAVYLPVGEGKIGWIDVRDIARANAHILNNPSPYLNTKITLTGKENLSYREALAIIAKETNRVIQFVDVPDEAAIKAMQEMGAPAFTIDMISSLNQIIKAGYAEGTSNAVLDITGQEPISFAQFVADYKDQLA